ncbi:hypothetical protein VOM14_27240 [Paraburkholderia sp. MPAMCS5]|uniref:hypothetical protein n=1 Tax=Paraburkholderia sp. MPAMCS5 TaxID=3112563 RepID=UPI002E190139|nr:hypothetical protein [Paraburkholderia sp. MPAMCS5]
MAYYMQGQPIEHIARELRRTERTVRDWLSGRERVPWWVPELLRLRDMEHNLRLQQMGVGRLAPRLHAVDGKVRELRLINEQPAPEPTPQLELLRPQSVA